jgi:iron complex transport system substrate-binding protein
VNSHTPISLKSFSYSNLVAIVSVSLILSACITKKDERPQEIPGKKVELKYAEGFTITAGDTWTLVEVIKPYQGASKGYRYLIVPQDHKIPPLPGEFKVIRTPINAIVCTSTTHIPLLDYLDITDKLVGFPTTDYISSEKARRRIEDGKVKDLGVDQGMNFEQLVMLKPNLVMGYTMSADYGQFKKIEEFGIPVILNAEYLEKHPLGRAEWIKFVAAFFDRSPQGDSVFSAIEKNYLATKQLAIQASKRPTVLSGIMYGDAWFLPGGQNYASKMLDDAGCNYLWRDDSSHGYLELSFERVFERANQADLWIGVGPFANLNELSAGDHRYKKFKPYADRTVYSYDARKGEKGGNEYLELGYLRPDLILKDLVKIAHPHLLPDHDLFFHRKLE